MKKLLAVPAGLIFGLLCTCTSCKVPNSNPPKQPEMPKESMEQQTQEPMQEQGEEQMNEEEQMMKKETQPPMGEIRGCERGSCGGCGGCGQSSNSESQENKESETAVSQSAVKEETSMKEEKATLIFEESMEATPVLENTK